MWKLRTREVRELAQSHTAFVRVGLDSEPGRSTPELAFLIMPVVTTVLPHATVFIISVCEPPIFEDLTQKSYCHHLAPSYSTFLQASVTTVSSLTSTGLQVSAPPLIAHSPFPACLVVMPQNIEEITDFLLTARGNNARAVKIKKNKDNMKFQVQWRRYLYALVITKRRQRNRSSPHLQVWLQKIWNEPHTRILILLIF